MPPAQDKEYVAGFTLGFATDTQDTTGETIRTSAARASLAEVQACLASFAGAQQQLPPMYSAVKVNGQKLYDLARKGKEIERTPRDIYLHEIELLDFDESAQKGSFRVVASKGTYVRTIVHDLGEKLGTFAAMHSLVRTRSGAYPLADTVGFEEVEQAMETGTIGTLLRPTDSLFLMHPAVYLTEEGRRSRGARRDCVPAYDTGHAWKRRDTLVRVYEGERFRMLGQVRALEKGGVGLFVYKNFR